MAAEGEKKKTQKKKVVSFYLMVRHHGWSSFFGFGLNFFFFFKIGGAFLGLFRLVALYKLTAREVHHCFKESVVFTYLWSC